MQSHNYLTNIHQYKRSSYYCTVTFKILVSKHIIIHNLSILSTNIQSINAKFSELEAFIYDLNDAKFNFSVICLQESWLNDNDNVSLFQLADYECTSQGKSSSTKGGLIMYIHKTLIYHIIPNQFTHRKWECHTIKLPSCGQTKDIILLNIMYRQII